MKFKSDSQRKAVMSKYNTNSPSQRMHRVPLEKRIYEKRFDEEYPVMKPWNPNAREIFPGEPGHTTYPPVQEKYENQVKNVATMPLMDARAYAEYLFNKSNQDLNQVIPDFDKNYQRMQTYCKFYAQDIPRIDMPVIEPSDMDKFEQHLKQGHIDIFQPYVYDSPYYPKSFQSRKQGEHWIRLGRYDGSKTDDMIYARIKRVKGSDLKPLQSQIHLDKLCNNIIRFGKPTQESRILDTTIIMSKEGYILDGHHRWGQVMLSNPNLKMKVLEVPLDIDTLLKVGRSYGSAIGNKPKA